MPKFNSWRESAAARRDTRQAPAPQNDNSRSIPNKRDKKRWCKGKTGVEHKFAVASREELGKDHGMKGRGYDQWLIRYCTGCGREVAWYYPLFKRDRKNPPAWVLEYRAQKKAS